MVRAGGLGGPWQPDAAKSAERGLCQRDVAAEPRDRIATVAIMRRPWTRSMLVVKDDHGVEPSLRRRGLRWESTTGRQRRHRARGQWSAPTRRPASHMNGVRRFLAATGGHTDASPRPAPSRTPRTARYLPAGYDVSHRDLSAYDRSRYTFPHGRRAQYFRDARCNATRVRANV
jgi:hypothetical protein